MAARASYRQRQHRRARQPLPSTQKTPPIQPPALVAELKSLRKRRYIFTFIDPNSRARIATTPSSKQAAIALNSLCEILPKPPPFILSDNGSEFLGAFQKQLEKRSIKQRWTYPRSPKMNPPAERFNRTIQEQFIDYHEDLLFTDLPKINQQLKHWLHDYNNILPHLSLNLQTPVQYLSQQLN